jgi:hypothetical protein
MPVHYRLVAFRADSTGACVWVESVFAPGVKFVDGGPTPFRVFRDGRLNVSVETIERCNLDLNGRRDR